MIREEVEVHERNVMETDHTGMITLVFMTAAGANEAARERFLSLSVGSYWVEFTLSALLFHEFYNSLRLRKVIGLAA
jgi:hypothetical protein